MLKKTTWKLGASLIGSTLGADLIAMILFACFGNWLDHRGAKIAFTLVSVLLLLWMIYSTAWNEGYRDPNRVKYGHMRQFLPKGLVAGCMAEVPLALVTLLFAVNLSTRWDNVWIRLVYFFCHIPYVFIINHFHTAIWLLAVLVLPVPVFAAAGYVMGYRQILLLGRLVYKRKPPVKSQKR